MYTDLPPHLQTLNAIPSSSSPPSSALNAEQEEAFWSFMHTDELFSNFGVAPSAFESKLENERNKANAQSSVSTSTPASDSATPETGRLDAPTLESFLATFANETPVASASLPGNYLLNLPVAFTPVSSSSAPTPAAHAVNPADVLPSSSANIVTPWNDDDDELSPVTGAKRLKQLGAGQAEIEEDKRRRNTEASARFRAKKKEREQALEQRAKELEQQVATLTAEKASLEKENSLLKFIVVNGNGGSALPVKGSDGLQAALAALGKRKREAE